MSINERGRSVAERSAINTLTAVLELIEAPENKRLLQVGAHDDSLSLPLARHFQHVSAWYEFVKIPEREERNLQIRRKPYSETLSHLNEFDVILLDNEFHHFPDIWQLWTYDRLESRQELLLVEWDFTGTFDHLYTSFQNCRPLCVLTREILGRCTRRGMIRIAATRKGESRETFLTRESLIDHFHFRLPDYWRFGEKEFLDKVDKLVFPVTLTEGFDAFKIVRNV